MDYPLTAITVTLSQPKENEKIMGLPRATFPSILSVIPKKKRG